MSQYANVIYTFDSDLPLPVLPVNKHVVVVRINKHAKAYVDHDIACPICLSDKAKMLLPSGGYPRDKTRVTIRPCQACEDAHWVSMRISPWLVRLLQRCRLIRF